LTVKSHKRIQVLLGLDAGKSYKTVGSEVGMTYISMREICDKYTIKQADALVLNYFLTR